MPPVKTARPRRPRAPKGPTPHRPWLVWGPVTSSYVPEDHVAGGQCASLSGLSAVVRERTDGRWSAGLSVFLRRDVDDPSYGTTVYASAVDATAALAMLRAEGELAIVSPLAMGLYVGAAGGAS